MAKLKTIAACIVLVTAFANATRSAAAQDDGIKAAAQPVAEATEPAKRAPPPPFALRDDYVVEPSDLIFVSIDQGLPGRPLNGERLVCPNGTITLAWYGQVEAAGLTVPEIKEKIIAQLRKFIGDEPLGLVALDANGKPVIDPTIGRPKRIAPKDSKKVRVEITQCNSKVFYVQGEVQSPGRFPLTGSENILDAIAVADGPGAAANLEKVLLYHADARGGPECFTVDVNQIRRGEVPSANYLLRAGDRVVVSRRAFDAAQIQPARSRPLSQPAVGATLQKEDGQKEREITEDQSLLRLEQRMNELDRKLDLVLEAIRKRSR